jgi:hypothetical protein
VKFVLNAPGMTSTSTISSVLFNFGTSPLEHTATGFGGYVGGGINPFDSPNPEPASWLILATGIAGVGVYRRRKAAVASQAVA